MLVEFTVGNYLSFKDKKTLSLEATSIKENPECVIKDGDNEVLRSIVIYGANSSGKSNFIKAITMMLKLIQNSAKGSSTDEIKTTPFLLSEETVDKPSFFEILFLIEKTRFRYGFEIDKSRVHSEWLFSKNEKTEKQLFIRNGDVIEVMTGYEEGLGLEEKTRGNALFISVVDQFNGDISKKIMEWVKNNSSFSGLDHESIKGLTSSFLSNETLSLWIKDFLIPLNLGFDDFSVEPEKKRVLTHHNKYDENGNVVGSVKFDLIDQESSGTNKLYDMSGRLTFGLKLGVITIIDELDAKLHPLLTMAIVKLFNSPEHNQKSAQIIFTTHDTNLLSSKLFRRDQIYFTEKNQFEATDLYSLVEYREPEGGKVRNDRSFEKDYISGRYGAIPFIGDFDNLIDYG